MQTESNQTKIGTQRYPKKIAEKHKKTYEKNGKSRRSAKLYPVRTLRLTMNQNNLIETPESNKTAAKIPLFVCLAAI